MVWCDQIKFVYINTRHLTDRKLPAPKLLASAQPTGYNTLARI